MQTAQCADSDLIKGLNWLYGPLYTIDVKSLREFGSFQKEKGQFLLYIIYKFFVKAKN